jgi:hypothetical protein
MNADGTTQTCLSGCFSSTKSETILHGRLIAVESPFLLSGQALGISGLWMPMAVIREI